MADHSNVYYTHEKDGTFIPRKNAVRFKNDLDADLFKHDKAISEGKTGLRICKESEFDDLVKNRGMTIESFAALVADAIEKHGLSPRYTQPEVTKEQLFPPSEKDENRKLARSFTESKRSYFTLHETLPDGTELYLRDRDKGADWNKTLFVNVDGWMFYVGSLANKESVVKRLQEPGFNIRTFLEEGLNAGFANPKSWVDIGVAEFFGRKEEALAHNAPIREARDAANRERDEQREAERREQEEKNREKYETAIKTAEQNIVDKKPVSNDELDEGQSLILQLFRENKIDLPLKTQGWVKKSLAGIKYNSSNEYWTYSYYGRPSTVIMDYLSRLVSAVEAKNIEPTKEKPSILKDIEETQKIVDTHKRNLPTGKKRNMEIE